MAGRGVLDLLTWLPGDGAGHRAGGRLIWAYVGLVRLPFPLYGTLWLLILAVTITTLTTGARTMSGTMVQIGPELEEVGAHARRILFADHPAGDVAADDAGHAVVLADPVRVRAEELRDGVRAVFAAVGGRVSPAVRDVERRTSPRRRRRWGHSTCCSRSCWCWSTPC